MATYTSNYGWTKPSGSDNVDISVLNDNLDDQDSTIHDAFLNMAPPFSESSTYAVDDIVLYGTGLYKCHTAVVTPGSWTGSTNWQVYKLSEGGSGGGGGTTNYNALTNKPQINSVELSGNKTSAQLGLMASDGVVANPTGQTTGTLTALEVGGTKYAVPSGGGGTSDYTDLTNKPSINGVTLSGNKTTSDLGIDKTAIGLGNVPNVATNDQTPTFTEASTRNNIASGEKLSVILGKVQKFFNDLKTVAFSGSYTDLSNKPSLATVATSGSYNDLSNKPTIPTSAGDITYDNTDSGLSATNVQGAMDELAESYPASKVMLNSGDSVEEKIGNVRMTKLWENSNPTQSMVSNTQIILSSSDYDLILWLVRIGTGTTNLVSAVSNKNGGVSVSATTSIGTSTRNINKTSDVIYKVSESSIGTVAHNEFLIPYQAYGIKST